LILHEGGFLFIIEKIMAKYRPIKTCFWSDDFISSISPNSKLLYLYFLTNERTTLCGIYRLPIRYVSFETSLKKKEIEVAMEELEEKITHHDGWIIIKNYKKHQSRSPKIKQGIKREEVDIPQEIKDLAYSMDTVSIGIDKPVLILKPILKPKLIKKKIYKKDLNISLVDENTKQKRKSSAKKKKDYEHLGEFKNVELTKEERVRLEERHGRQVADKAVMEMSEWLKQNNKTYKDYYAALLGWIRRSQEKTNQPKSIPKYLTYKDL